MWDLLDPPQTSVFDLLGCQRTPLFLMRFAVICEPQDPGRYWDGTIKVALLQHVSRPSGSRWICAVYMTFRTAFASASVAANGSAARLSGYFSHFSYRDQPSTCNISRIVLRGHVSACMISLGAALFWILDLLQTDDIVLLRGSNKERQYYLASRKSLVPEDSVLRFEHSLLDLLPCVLISTLDVGFVKPSLASIDFAATNCCVVPDVVLWNILPLQHPS